MTAAEQRYCVTCKPLQGILVDIENHGSGRCATCGEEVGKLYVVVADPASDAGKVYRMPAPFVRPRAGKGLPW